VAYTVALLRAGRNTQLWGGLLTNVINLRHWVMNGWKHMRKTVAYHNIRTSLKALQKSGFHFFNNFFMVLSNMSQLKN